MCTYSMCCTYPHSRCSVCICSAHRQLKVRGTGNEHQLTRGNGTCLWAIRKIGIFVHRQIDRCQGKQSNFQINGWTQRCTDRYTDRYTDRLTDRQIDRQIDTHRFTGIYIAEYINRYMDVQIHNLFGNTYHAMCTQNDIGF